MTHTWVVGVGRVNKGGHVAHILGCSYRKG